MNICGIYQTPELCQCELRQPSVAFTRGARGGSGCTLCCKRLAYISYNQDIYGNFLGWVTSGNLYTALLIAISKCTPPSLKGVKIGHFEKGHYSTILLKLNLKKHLKCLNICYLRRGTGWHHSFFDKSNRACAKNQNGRPKINTK